jgi:hypothetical protein
MSLLFSMSTGVSVSNFDMEKGHEPVKRALLKSKVSQNFVKFFMSKI